MPASAATPGPYADAPRLRKGAIRGTLQLLSWLFLRPTAWREHVRRFDIGLPPDFSVSHLSPAHARHPGVRQLLLRGHVVAPLLASLVLVIELLTLGITGRDLFVRVLACALGGIIGGGVAGAATSVAAGIGVGFYAALTGSLAFGVATLLVGQVPSGAGGGVAAIVADLARGGVAGTVALAVAAGVAAGVVFLSDGGLQVLSRPAELGAGGDVSASRASSADSARRSGAPFIDSAQRSGAPFIDARARGVGGVPIGLFVGGLYFALALTSALRLPFAAGVAFTGFVAAATVVHALTRSAPRSLLFGLWTGAVNCLTVVYLAPALGDVVVVGVLIGGLLSGWFSVPYLIAERVGGPWAGAIAGSLGVSGGWLLVMSSGVPFHGARQLLSQLTSTPGFALLGALLLCGVVLGLTQSLWRPLLFYPFEEAWDLLLYRLDRDAPTTPPRLRQHAAFWDELQRRPLYSLPSHLLLIIERDPAEGQAALQALSSGPQRWAAQAVQIELLARRLGACQDADAIAAAHALLGEDELPGPASALLRGLSRVCQDVRAALQQGTAHNQRLGLAAAEARLEQFLGELQRSSDRYAARFQGIARGWQRLLTEASRARTEAAEQLQEIDNPYVIGVPLTLQQELFVGREDISARIEHLLLDRRRPPLMLYGQRRMGKTSLLNNLGRLLRASIVPLFVDLQGPASAATDHAGLLYNLARGMIDSARRQRGLVLPPLLRDTLRADPFTSFDEWLDAVEVALGEHTALLCLDELEALDRALAEGRFNEAQVLGMLRHLVQHRPRFKVLLATSLCLEELQRWSSYLINVQVVPVPYLKDDEARKLIERPVPEPQLRYAPEATAAILSLTRGHPFLTQLLCSEIVALKNEQPPAERRFCTAADVAEAVPLSLRHGSFFFADIEKNQIDPPARQALLQLAVVSGSGPGLPVSDEVLAQLRRRDLVEDGPSGLRFQVELIRRWFVAAAPGAHK